MTSRFSGWTVLKWRGVAVKLHISLILLLFYVILMSMVQFPFVVEYSGVNPVELSGTPFGWAVVFAVSLLASIVIHEFAHVIVAQSKGYAVKDVTLMMLGGVSQMERLPEKPSVELRVAIIGPIVSFLIALLLFQIRRVSTNPNLDFYCFWLGQTNLVLAIFNMIPAFPTDGGRVLRSLLVSLQGRLRGTQNAVRVSTVFAWLFGILGFIQFNFLLILMAFFIYAAARSELFILTGQILFKGLVAKDYTIAVPVISENATAAEAVALMSSSQNLILPVILNDQSYALINSRIIEELPNKDWTGTRVGEICIKCPFTIPAQEPLEEAFMKVMSAPLGVAPVVEYQKFIGLLRSRELIEMLQLRQLTVEQFGTKLPWRPKAAHSH